MILNPKMTKLLTTELHDHDFVVLQNGSKIDEIRDHASYRWLSKACCFTNSSLHCHAIDSRIAATTRVLYAKKHILRAKHIPIGGRLRYFNLTTSQIACFAGSSTTLTRHSLTHSSLAPDGAWTGTRNRN